MSDDDSIDALREKLKNVEAECHSLLTRAIQSEQQHADAAAERDNLKSTTSELCADKADLENRLAAALAEMSDLKDAVAKSQTTDDRDVNALLEQERSNARRHNELRLELEQSFAELSTQFESLQTDHEDCRDKLKVTSRDLDDHRARVKSLEEQAAALEQAAAQTAEDRDSARTQVVDLRSKLEDETKAKQAAQRDASRAQNSLKDLRQQHDELQKSEDRLKRELDSLKKRSSLWKRQAEQAQELEVRNEQLVSQATHAQRELNDARQMIMKLQQQIISLEEEHRRQREEMISPKTVQFLRDQLAEAQGKYKELREKERGWLSQRAALEGQIKRLKYELGKKNPSQLKLMEMEVQNELLLGMLQTSPPRSNARAAAAKQRASPPPRKLPPLDSPQVAASPEAESRPTE